MIAIVLSQSRADVIALFPSDSDHFGALWRALVIRVRCTQPFQPPSDTLAMPHSAMLCPCPRDALCLRCRADLFAQLRGVAACRGETWAERVAHHVSREHVWPPHDGRAADIARRLVGDLARDPVLVDMLASELARWAARRWNEPRE